MPWLPRLEVRKWGCHMSLLGLTASHEKAVRRGVTVMLQGYLLNRRPVELKQVLLGTQDQHAWYPATHPLIFCSNQISDKDVVPLGVWEGLWEGVCPANLSSPMTVPGSPHNTTNHGASRALQRRGTQASTHRPPRAWESNTELSGRRRAPALSTAPCGP